MVISVKKRPRLFWSAGLGLVLLLVSVFWLLSLFGSQVGGSEDYELLSPTKTVALNITCNEGFLLPGFSLHLDESDSSVVVVLQGSVNPYSLQGCTRIGLSTSDLTYDNLDVWFDLEPAETDMPWAQSPDESVPATGGGSSIDRHTYIDIERLTGDVDSIVIGIRPTDVLTQTAADLWVADVDYRFSYYCSDCRKGHDFGSMIVSHDISIDSYYSLDGISPAPRVSSLPDGQGGRSLQYHFDNNEEIAVTREQAVRFVSELRTTTTLRDDSYEAGKTMQILIASTLFGAAISILIEVFLSLELYRLVLQSEDRRSAKELRGHNDANHQMDLFVGQEETTERKESDDSKPS